MKKICISPHLFLSLSLSVLCPPFPLKCFPLLVIVLKKIIQEFINSYQQQINKITKLCIKFMDRKGCLINFSALVSTLHKSLLQNIPFQSLHVSLYSAAI